MAATDDQLQEMLGTRPNRRYHEKAKFGIVKIFIPDGDVGRVLELDLSMSGHKFRVAKWRSFKAPSHRVHQSASAYATNRQNGRRRAAKSESVATARKERACFVAEFLDAQAGPGGRRLYSQVASKTTEAKTAEARMKSMETAICD